MTAAWEDRVLPGCKWFESPLAFQFGGDFSEIAASVTTGSYSNLIVNSGGSQVNLVALGEVTNRKVYGRS